MRKLLILFIFCYNLVSCSKPQKGISQLWFYTYSNNADANTETSLTPASFLYLMKDGNYTSDFGVFDNGKWIFKDKLLRLTNDKGKTIVYNARMAGDHELQLSSPTRPLDNFESMPADFPNAIKDPFSTRNNQWRIPATHKESDAEIRKRLALHFRFWETYFNWALDDGLQSVDVNSTPTLIDIYGNGFALKSFDKLSPQWKSYFFDEADCQKATEMVEYHFKQHDIAWAHTDNRFKMFISAFQQLQQQFK